MVHCRGLCISGPHVLLHVWARMESLPMPRAEIWARLRLGDPNPPPAPPLGLRLWDACTRLRLHGENTFISQRDEWQDCSAAEKLSCYINMGFYLFSECERIEMVET